MNDKAPQRSRELFDSGFYCAESVLLAIAEANGIVSDVIPRIATGFCGGISRTSGICGAVSGAIMGINLVTGRISPEETVDKSYRLTKRLIELFERKFGFSNCQKLTGYDLDTEEGLQAFQESGRIEQCKEYTEEAARIAMMLIDELQ